MKKVAVFGIVAALVLAFALPAFGEPVKVRKIDPIDNRAMGGADLATDTRIPSNAALSDDPWSLTLFNVELKAPLSQGLRMKDVIGDAAGIGGSPEEIFQKALADKYLKNDSSTLKEREDQLKDMLSRSNFNLGVTSRVEALRLTVGNKKWGKFTMGAYGEADVGVLVTPPNPANVKIVEKMRDSYIDLGGSKRAVQALGRGDAGGLLGYGLAFNLPKKMEIAGGVQVRVFDRFMVPTQSVGLKREFRGQNDVVKPDNFNYVNGIGFATDLSTTFAGRDPYLDTKVAFVVTDIGNIWYDSGADELTSPRYGLGVSISPFHYLKHDKMVLAVDVEDMQDGGTLQMGLAYMLGNKKVNLTPRVGIIVHETDLFGRDSNIFTAGFSTKLAIFNLAGLYERNLDSQEYNVGCGFGMEI